MQHQAFYFAQPAKQSAATKANTPIAATAPAQTGPVTQDQVNTALALFQSGQIAQALTQAQILARHAPDLLPVLDLQGAALRKLDKPLQALPFFERSLEVAGPSAPAHFNIGATLFDLCRYDGAASHLKQAITLAPQNQTMIQTLALCFKEMGRYHDTVELLAQGLESGQTSGATLNILGLALYHLNCLEEAKSCFCAVTDSPSTMAEAQSHLGTLAKAQGNSQQAQAHYLNALKLDPMLATAHRNLSAVTRYEAGHPHLEAMQILLKQPGLSKANQAELNFALFKAFQDIREFEVAFEHLKTGNLLKHQGIGYSVQTDEALFAHLRQVFDRPAPEAHSELPFRPIFIVGLPRSGTTLTEQILCGCEGVTGAGELQYASTAMAQLLQQMQQAGQTAPIAEQIQALRSELAERMLPHSKGAPVLIDKMPLNLRWVGALLAAFPEARVIHTTRPPQDNCWSLYKVCFQGSGNGFAYDLQSAARFQILADDLMQHWQALFPGRIHHLDHSLLTAEPEAHARALVDFCGLQWSEDCLHPERQTQAILTASAQQVRRPIYQQKTSDWAPYQAQLASLSALYDSNPG